MSQVELFRNQSSAYTIDDHITGDDGQTYIVGDRIAAGGNAVVHECNEKLSGDNYAVKFQLELRHRRRERFQREVELLRGFDDPHIIRFVAAGTVAGLRTERVRRGGRPVAQRRGVGEELPFVILMKASEDLGKHAKTPQKIPPATYLAQFLGLSKALVKVNEKALHRDIKPENILVVGSAWAISDFGLCDLHEGGPDLSRVDERIGPALWMSPEAFNKNLGCSDAIGQTSEVFQLASVFWYATCGRHPTGIVRNTDWRGPPELFPIMERALLHDNLNRFQTSAEFSEALEAVIIR
ncbi:MAG: protein kinase [Polynucleobacter sp.]|uniref:protein kinase domain-containing protein n=1 Tax=Hydrogenophaga sp. TaxID=1904254 RepID=UPI002ABA8558|nr:protein kinase [Hydrogenophaga sp.]MDZ4055806.1 protein kinase [Polynucleobacter sp.]MDZ4281322.1 protein kinase [Hydrogenophaga sp.]